MPDPWRVVLDREVIKTLSRLPRDLRERLRHAIDDLAVDPRGPGRRKLQGHRELYRRRVGDWRIIYVIYDDKLVVLVIEVAPRDGAYRDL